MNISIENPDAMHFVKSYEPGKITLNTGDYSQSIVIHQNNVIPWAPASIADLTAEAMMAIAERKPHLVLLGTGVQQHFPSHDILSPLYKAKIGVEIMSTEAACRTYNLLADEGRNVLAALLVA